MEENQNTLKTNRILSGMRPTGKLHIGHYFGVLVNWLKFQEDSSYEKYYMIADWHAFFSEATNKEFNLKKVTLDILIDWLSAGIDPNKVVIFRQSDVPEHLELHIILSALTPMSWLERNPTYKDALENIKNKDIRNYAFFGYPVLQTADIVLYKADTVPVGEDQLPHLELAREIVRRFNYYYGLTFPEPQSILTKAAKILGIDRRKMSKSYNNAIYLSDSSDEVNKKVMSMITDESRIKKTDPGHPDICNVFSYWNIFESDKEKIEWVKRSCIKAEIGCVQCKRELAKKINEFLEPIREKRSYYENHKDELYDILEEGKKKAKQLAVKTIEEVKDRIKI